MRNRREPATTTCLTVGAWWLFATTALAGPPQDLPRALPLHSASTSLLPPPANDQPELLPAPLRDEPLRDSLLLAAPTWPEEPPPAPLFSWRPTHIPKDAKSGIFQQSLFRTTYLPRLGDGGFGMTDVNKQFTFALPPFIAGSPFLFTPSFTSHFLDGPNTVNLPSELYDIELELRWAKQLTGRWGLDLAVAPSYFGDGTNRSSAAFRVTARAIAAWDWTPTVKLVGGILILGRADYPAIPVGGVMWKPSPDWRWEVIVPRPRILHRISVQGNIEQWLYLGGEFGGNTWAIESAGMPDKVTYSDLRLVLGWQRVAPHGLNGRVEVGWVFDRDITLESNLPGFVPNDTLLARGELSY